MQAHFAGNINANIRAMRTAICLDKPEIVYNSWKNLQFKFRIRRQMR